MDSNRKQNIKIQQKSNQFYIKTFRFRNPIDIDVWCKTVECTMACI